MRTIAKPFTALTTGDIMSREVARVPHTMGMRDAARLLLQAQVSGAPVVDLQGRCVGVLSAADFIRLAERPPTSAPPQEQPLTCGFEQKWTDPGGRDVILCTLQAGVCPLQRPENGPGGRKRLLCTEPHSVPADWQMVNVERLPADPVHRYMTADVATVPPEMLIRELARRMIDAHIHRLIVVDGQGRPVGIVSSTDILAALVYAE